MSFLGKMGKMFAGAAAAPTTASSTRSVAKERLSVILASQRGSELLEGVDMDALQRDVMQVVKKHIQSVKNEGPVQMSFNYEGEVSLFEMSVELDAPGPRRTHVSTTKAA